MWELLAYAAYALVGFAGNFLLNIMTLLGIYAVVWARLKRLAVSSVVAKLSAVLSLLLISRYFYVERPQMVFFLLATVLLGLFEAIR